MRSVWLSRSFRRPILAGAFWTCHQSLQALLSCCHALWHVCAGAQVRLRGVAAAASRVHSRDHARVLQVAWHHSPVPHLITGPLGCLCVSITVADTPRRPAKILPSAQGSSGETQQDLCAQADTLLLKHSGNISLDQNVQVIAPGAVPCCKGHLKRTASLRSNDSYMCYPLSQHDVWQAEL
jgi:hypothetical protein